MLGKRGRGVISKQRGVTLIEVLIAFCIIGVSSLGLAKLQAYMEQRSDYAYHNLQALGLAEAKLEWFRTRGADDESSTMDVADFMLDIVDGLDSSHPIYTVVWTVPKTTMAGRVKTVQVDVSWSDRLNRTHTLSLATQISRYNEFE
ncbi:type IV pilus modification PilV family protein [Vibrio parahaemolyticus]|uniref:type IV pilus modification PilV family protein n=1 Tax=Vibrio mediterranei TaxID=689 RepID=UPI0040675F82